LELAGWSTRLGRPGPDDWVGVWGKSPTAHRGEAAAKRHDVPLLRVEDAFLRSVHPGRAGSPPMGLLLDKKGVHFDSSAPSALEVILATERLDETNILDRARVAMARMKALHLSKYNAFDPALTHPLAGKPYVLVIDQTRGDASIKHAGARASTFREMLVFAQEEHPGLPVLIKTHPEANAGLRPGHYGVEDETARVNLVAGPHSPWHLLEGAAGVYTVSSGLGFEAIIAGHNPRVFGQPFYSGWGLTQDENPVPRRTRKLTRAQLFAAAMILYPTWHDPHSDALCEIETVLDNLEAQARAWREDRHGYVASGMRLWKRDPLQRFYGREKRLVFADKPKVAVAKAQESGRHLMVWAGKATNAHMSPDIKTLRVEDGFLRSRGLGAELTPPLSLVTDDLGIYYDPSQPSRLERLIGASTALPAYAIDRAEALIERLKATKLTKYNLEWVGLPELPQGRRILVPGQVEDDASIQLGCGNVRTNLGLLQATRAANPEAVIVYKPHPDVEAGLRTGRIEASELADVVADRADPLALIDAVDEVWTMTSLLGFEALLRARKVTILGMPFYGGWGLTNDLGDVPGKWIERRIVRPSLSAVVHATLIAYPRYFDPVAGLPCPVEVVVERLAAGALPRPGPTNRMMSKMQGLLASHATFRR
ncbi:MAG: capsular polysaccharide biosynthesis protein, partial [Rhodobacteraceae bacterium]|nr:capsular polysaccharide biosynthesis protein [Paracoccaceae bacterium]